MNKKIVSIVTVLLFLSQEIAMAIPLSGQPLPEVSLKGISLEQIQISEGLGKIEKKYISQKSDMKFFVIQDAHAVIDAQMNTHKIINEITQQEPVSMVGVEGAEGKLETLLLSSFPNQKTKKKVFEEFLDHGEMTGAEFTSVMNDQSIDYLGLEDWDLYKENYAAYLNNKSREELLRNRLDAYGKELEKDRLQVYSENLENLHVSVSNYLGEERDFPGLMSIFMKHQEILKRNQSFNDFIPFIQIFKEHSREDKRVLDLTLRILVKSFIDKYRSELTFSEKQKANRILQEINVNTKSYEQIFEEIIELANQYNATPKFSPPLHNLQKRVSILNSLKHGKFYEKFNQAIEFLENELAVSDREEALVVEYRDLRLVQKLVDLRLSSDEWVKYLEATEKEGGVIEKLNFDENFKYAESFYRVALERDRILYEKAKTALNQKNAKSIIVQVGGFHSRGMIKQLEKDDISYLLITPEISNLSGEENYQHLMEGRRSYPTEKGKTIYESFAEEASRKLVEKLQPTERLSHLKEWRDKVIRKAVEKKNIGNVYKETKHIDQLIHNYYSNPSEENTPEKKKEFLNVVKNILGDYRQKILSVDPNISQPLGAAVQSALGSQSPFSNKPPIFSVLDIPETEVGTERVIPFSIQSANPLGIREEPIALRKASESRSEEVLKALDKISGIHENGKITSMNSLGGRLSHLASSVNTSRRLRFDDATIWDQIAVLSRGGVHAFYKKEILSFIRLTSGSSSDELKGVEVKENISVPELYFEVLPTLWRESKSLQDKISVIAFGIFPITLDPSVIPIYSKEGLKKIFVISRPQVYTFGALIGLSLISLAVISYLGWPVITGYITSLLPLITSFLSSLSISQIISYSAILGGSLFGARFLYTSLTWLYRTDSPSWTHVIQYYLIEQARRAFEVEVNKGREEGDLITIPYSIFFDTFFSEFDLRNRVELEKILKNPPTQDEMEAIVEYLFGELKKRASNYLEVTPESEWFSAKSLLDYQQKSEYRDPIAQESLNEEWTLEKFEKEKDDLIDFIFQNERLKKQLDEKGISTGELKKDITISFSPYPQYEIVSRAFFILILMIAVSGLGFSIASQIEASLLVANTMKFLFIALSVIFVPFSVIWFLWYRSISNESRALTSAHAIGSFIFVSPSRLLSQANIVNMFARNENSGVNSIRTTLLHEITHVLQYLDIIKTDFIANAIKHTYTRSINGGIVEGEDHMDQFFAGGDLGQEILNEKTSPDVLRDINVSAIDPDNEPYDQMTFLGGLAWGLTGSYEEMLDFLAIVALEGDVYKAATTVGKIPRMSLAPNVVVETLEVESKSESRWTVEEISRLKDENTDFLFSNPVFRQHLNLRGLNPDAEAEKFKKRTRIVIVDGSSFETRFFDILRAFLSIASPLFIFSSLIVAVVTKGFIAPLLLGLAGIVSIVIAQTKDFRSSKHNRWFEMRVRRLLREVGWVVLSPFAEGRRINISNQFIYKFDESGMKRAVLHEMMHVLYNMKLLPTDFIATSVEYAMLVSDLENQRITQEEFDDITHGKQIPIWGDEEIYYWESFLKGAEDAEKLLNNQFANDQILFGKYDLRSVLDKNGDEDYVDSAHLAGLAWKLTSSADSMMDFLITAALRKDARYAANSIGEYSLPQLSTPTPIGTPPKPKIFTTPKLIPLKSETRLTDEQGNKFRSVWNDWMTNERTLNVGSQNHAYGAMKIDFTASLGGPVKSMDYLIKLYAIFHPDAAEDFHELGPEAILNFFQEKGYIAKESAQRLRQRISYLEQLKVDYETIELTTTLAGQVLFALGQMSGDWTLENLVEKSGVSDLKRYQDPVIVTRNGEDVTISPKEQQLFAVQTILDLTFDMGILDVDHGAVAGYDNSFKVKESFLDHDEAEFGELFRRKRRTVFRQQLDDISLQNYWDISEIFRAVANESSSVVNYQEIHEKDLSIPGLGLRETNFNEGYIRRKQIYIKSEKEGFFTPEQLIDIFKYQVREKAIISFPLLKKIKDQVNYYATSPGALSEEKLSVLREGFIDMLRMTDRNVSGAIWDMYFTGFLPLIIPELAPLKTVYDEDGSIHYFNVISHTLYVLEQGERLAETLPDEEVGLFGVANDIIANRIRKDPEQTLAFRLGIILHDSGKAKEGYLRASHQIAGARQVVPKALEPFGLSSRTQELIANIAWYHQHINAAARDITGKPFPKSTFEALIADWQEPVEEGAESENAIVWRNLNQEMVDLIAAVGYADQLGLDPRLGAYELILYSSKSKKQFQVNDEWYQAITDYLAKPEAERRAAGVESQKQSQEKDEKTAEGWAVWLEQVFVEDKETSTKNIEEYFKLENVESRKTQQIIDLMTQEIQENVRFDQLFNAFVRTYTVSYLRRAPQIKDIQLAGIEYAFLKFVHLKVMNQLVLSGAIQVPPIRTYPGSFRRSDQSFLQVNVAHAIDLEGMAHKIAGVMFAYGLNIHEAQIFSSASKGGFVIDIFKVNVTRGIWDAAHGEHSMKDEFDQDIKDVLIGEKTVFQVIRDRYLKEGLGTDIKFTVNGNPRFPTKVKFKHLAEEDGYDSGEAELEMQTTDRNGLLFLVGIILSLKFGVDIVHAPIRTYQTGSVNRFIIRRRDGGDIREIEDSIRTAFGDFLNFENFDITLDEVEAFITQSESRNLKLMTHHVDLLRKFGEGLNPMTMDPEDLRSFPGEEPVELNNLLGSIQGAYFSIYLNLGGAQEDSGDDLVLQDLDSQAGSILSNWQSSLTSQRMLFDISLLGFLDPEQSDQEIFEAVMGTLQDIDSTIAFDHQRKDHISLVQKIRQSIITRQLPFNSTKPLTDRRLTSVSGQVTETTGENFTAFLNRVREAEIAINNDAIVKRSVMIDPRVAKALLEKDPNGFVKLLQVTAVALLYPNLLTKSADGKIDILDQAAFNRTVGQINQWAQKFQLEEKLSASA